MAEWCADNLRSVQAWKAEGLRFSTSSDEATKLYDGLLRQLVSWTDCASLGGLGATAKKMIEADPTAILPRAFTFGLDVMSTGTSARINKSLESDILQIEKDANERGTEWEKDHVTALKSWGYGHFRAATDTWERILVEHPNDLLALKMAHDAYFFMGDKENMRDSLKRVLPTWKKEAPCYSYLHGMYAFGLEECGQYREAEKEATTMAEWCADNLRSVQAWKAEGLRFSTSSDEATKLYDGLLRQLVSWTDCASLGGLGATAKKMIEADPTAILPRAFTFGLDVMSTGTSARINKSLESDILQIEKDANERGTEWEKDHVTALKSWGYGHFRAATDTWERILVEHPNDLLALKMAHDAYFFMGDKENMRDSLKRVLPTWKKEAPCYSYLHGMYAFGLEECGQYREAEKEATTGLTLNRFDCWSTHARAHVLEMEGRYKEGIDFITATQDDWIPGLFLATHNFWHNALFHIEKADYETALSIFDTEVSVRTSKSLAMLDVVDAVSLLQRLEMEGVNVGNRWKKLPSMASHCEDHIIAFNDVHFGALFQKSGEVELEKKMHVSLVNFTKSGSNDNSKVNEIVGLRLYEGMADYMNEKYDSAAEKMLPVRNEVYRIGGSHAQRDLFAQALIHACTMSEKEDHWKMTPVLLEERASIRSGQSPLAERLALKFRQRHPL